MSRAGMEYDFHLSIEISENFAGFIEHNEMQSESITWSYEDGLGIIFDQDGFTLFTFILDDEMFLTEIPHDETQPGVYVLLRQ
jgi:hypothetical protein